MRQRSMQWAGFPRVLANAHREQSKPCHDLICISG
jgi:hypothetical protein